MDSKNPEKLERAPDESREEKKEDFIDVFRYFENANTRNREAFCELLDYTIENRKDT